MVLSQATTISGVSISETPAISGETFTATLSDTNGLLAAAGAGVSGAGTTSLTIVGSLSEVNAALATLSYLSNSPGVDTIAVNAVDSFGDAALQTSTDVTVLPVAPPAISVATGTTVVEPGTTPIAVTVADPDGTAPGEALTVTVSDTVGLLSANANAPGGGGTITGSGSATLVVTGTPTAVEADLSTLSYTSATPGSDTVVVSASSSDGGATSPETFTVVTSAPPVIAAPPSAIAVEGEAYPISGISISDPLAADDETFSVTLADAAGLLAATGSGVSGSGTTSLTISGSLSQVNSDLATLTDDVALNR